MLKFGRVYPLTPWGELTCWKLGHPSNMGEWKKPAFSCWDMILGERVCISLLKKIPYCFFFVNINHRIMIEWLFRTTSWRCNDNDQEMICTRWFAGFLNHQRYQLVVFAGFCPWTAMRTVSQSAGISQVGPMFLHHSLTMTMGWWHESPGENRYG